MRTRELWVCVAISALFCACDRTTEYVQTVAPGPTTCAQCHDPSNLITGKKAEWAQSVHGTGTAYLAEGPNASCAGCHSGHAFQLRIAAGLNPDEVKQGDTDPTPQDCRACHNIHETYTEQDFALRTDKAVKLYAVANATFNGGDGNLCVNCHQPRRDAPVAVNGVITGISTHWGPHHGPQSAMLLGVAGAGVTGSPSGHYAAVPNTCVQCHMGDTRNHTFEPQVATCQPCHQPARRPAAAGRSHQRELARRASDGDVGARGPGYCAMELALCRA
jgi:nitrate/TMAO reductase-like tetraheme cytochrome c subunit